MLGASFLTRAIHQARQHQESATRSLKLTKLLGQGLRADGKLSDDHQSLLFELSELIVNEDYAPSEISCPECQAAMAAITIHDIEIDFCPACRGFWFDHDELKVFTGSLTDVPGIRLTSRKSKFNCPRCEESAMREYQFDRLHNLMVDCCPHCHGVYLQDQEFERSLIISDE